jgi:hypothetical protein
MIPPEAETEFKRQPHEKAWIRKIFIAAVIAALILIAVGFIVHFYGTRHTS